jgi:hypothetical protein
MKKRRANLYLVGQDPAEIFDDLDKLKTDLTSPPSRRPAGPGQPKPLPGFRMTRRWHSPRTAWVGRPGRC